MITGVGFICLPTNDFEASVKFYEETLGLPRGKQWRNMPGIEFQAGNLTLAIMQPEAFGQDFRARSLAACLFTSEDYVRASRERRSIRAAPAARR